MTKVLLSSIPNRLRLPLALSFGAVLAFFGFLFPSYNWDIIGYTAAAYHHQGLRDDRLHEATFTDLKQHVPPGVYQQLIQGNIYRETVAEDPKALSQQMPFYTIRVAYVAGMIYLRQWTSLPFPQATYIISSFFAGLCGLVLFLKMGPASRLAVILFLPILNMSGLFELTALSTPDSMAAVLALAACWLFNTKNATRALIPLIALPFVRTDYIILSGLFSLCFWLRGQRKTAVLLCVLSLAAYVWVNRAHANYGYLKILNFTLMNNTPYPATMAIETNLTAYLEIYRQGFAKFLGHIHFAIFLIYFITWYRWVKPLKISRNTEQVFIVLGFVLIHLLLFPAYYQRFFSWCAALAAMQTTAWLVDRQRRRSFSSLP